MSKISKKDISNLISWSKNHYGQLPWRKNRSLYGTLVSEIMLQQTTVGTVLNHFEKFLKRFPTLESLAKASETELAIEWKGLGYYRRARNLRNAAIQITEEHKAKIPFLRDELLKIKGIGDYTADALISIGHDKRALAVDANIERVMARVLGLNNPKGLELQKEIRSKFYLNLFFKEKDVESFRALNEALMDLGRVLCQSKKTTCNLCPLKDCCVSFKENRQLDIPFQIKKEKISHNLILLRVKVIKNNKILVYKKKKGEWLEDQFELPTFIIESDDKSLKQYPFLKKKIKIEKLLKLKSTITKYKVLNYLIDLEFDSFKKDFDFKEKIYWVSLRNFFSENLSTTSIKLLKTSENIL